MNRIYMVVLATAAALLVAVGVASAVGQSAGTPRAHLTDSADLAVFGSSFSASSSQAAALRAIASTYANAPDGSMLASVNLQRARPVRSADGTTTAWVAPTSGGGLCSFTPQPGSADGSFAASCATLDEMNDTGNVSATMGPSGSGGTATITVVEPDGVDAPVVVTPAGGMRQLPLQSNVAVGSVHAGDAVRVSGVELKVPAATSNGG